MLISAGFDSALGDPLGGVGVTPTGYAMMTWGLRNLCKKTVAVLEGGYDLNSLEVSSVAVIRTLQLCPEDITGFNNLLSELSHRETSLSQLETEAFIHIRESFKQTASNLAKLLKNYWPFLSGLICEKSRKRTGSGLSSVEGTPSLGSSLGDHGLSDNTAARLGRIARTLSMQEESSLEVISAP